MQKTEQMENVDICIYITIFTFVFYTAQQQLRQLKTISRSKQFFSD